MYKSKIIIFGGQGYIGTNLINFLKKKETEIISIGRNANLNKNNNTDNIYKFVKTFKTDFFNLKNLDKINFDHSTIIFSGLNGKVSNKTFALQFTKLIKFLNKKKIKRIILLSSISVYGIKKIKLVKKVKLDQ